MSPAFQTTTTMSWRVFLFFLIAASLAVQPSLSFDCNGCICELDQRYLSVDCRHMELTAVPEFIRWTNYTSHSKLFLRLDSNNITSISSEDFSGLTNLTNLGLSHNQISYIENDSFVISITETLSLDLSHNNLTNDSFGENAFNGGHKIDVLDLSYNLLTEPPKVLKNHKRIFQLILDYNPLGPTLRNTSFIGYSPEIGSLSLAGCGLQKIEPKTFDVEIFSDLRTLNLDSNNFSVIDRDFLKGAYITFKLTLRDAGIRKIMPKTFSKQYGLNKLLLSHNNLSNQTSRNPFTSLVLKDLELNNCSLQRIKRGFLRLKVFNLDLSDNDITLLGSEDLRDLKNTIDLKLSNNRISKIKGKPFRNLTSLSYLYLSNNYIDDSNLEFLGNSSVNYLYLSYNSMSTFPNVSNLTNLVTLHAMKNTFKEIPEETFTNNGYLEELYLGLNWNLRSFSQKALRGNRNLKVIDVSHTSLENLPNFDQLANLRKLRLDHSQFKELPKDLCRISPKLEYLYASYNKLESVSDLVNCTSLVHLELEDNRIRNISEKTFKGLSRLEVLSLHTNHIETVHPEAFHGLRSLKRLDLSHNFLQGLHENLFANLTYVTNLELQHNKITRLPENIFKDLIHLEALYLNENSINEVGGVIFPPNMTWLQDIDISQNREMPKFPLPVHGFPFLRQLNMSGLPRIYDVPTVRQIPRIQIINFTYSYHCCIFEDYAPNPHVLDPEDTSPTDFEISFVQQQANEVTLPPHIMANLIFPEDVGDPFDHTDNTITPNQFITGLKNYQETFNVTIVPAPGGRVAVISNANSTNVIGYLGELETQYLHRYAPSFFVEQEVQCSPQPNALTPCKNLLDPQPLPVIVWFVWFIAVVSNLAVLFVMLVSKEKIKVPQFFICNLALADFLLGIYLAFLGAVDVRTRGKSFYKSALTWQNGPGCQSAGFIAIFASELSIFVLTAMTLERLHTIAYSFKRGRLRMRYAIFIVLICWIIAGILAALPLLDVNSYSHVAICLPFRVEEIRDKIFIALLLTLNITAFLIILFCYMRLLYLFCSSPSADQTSKRDKVVIALKMGTLVLSNIVCWLPLATVGYAAVVDEYLIDIITAKYFVILIFPFNACLNPFIYSIFTRQFTSRVKSVCKRSDRLQLVNQSSLRLSIRRNSIASGSDGGSSVTRTNSPRCDIDWHALNQRHSRRSFSVQLEMPSANPILPSMTTSMSSVPYMGRRYSSPAIFATDTKGSQTPSSSNKNKNHLGLRFSSDYHHHTANNNMSEISSPHNTISSPSSCVSEVHRAHSNCLSVVHEESDEEMAEVCRRASTPPTTRRQRRHSDPDINRSGPLKTLVLRGDRVADTENHPVRSTPNSRTTPYREATPSTSSVTTKSRNSSCSDDENTVTVNTITTRNNHGISPSLNQLIQYRLSNSSSSGTTSSTNLDIQHSIRIINPHASKMSKLPLEETQV